MARRQALATPEPRSEIDQAKGQCIHVLEIGSGKTVGKHMINRL